MVIPASRFSGRAADLIVARMPEGSSGRGAAVTVPPLPTIKREEVRIYGKR